jgi:hypothetical protein
MLRTVMPERSASWSIVRSSPRSGSDGAAMGRRLRHRLTYVTALL